MLQVLRGFFWTLVYLALVLTPLFVLLLRPVPAGNGFWWDLSAALGFASAAMLGVMFILTARFKRATAPFGIDIIYYFHRLISLVILTFLAMHIAIFPASDPVILHLLAPTVMPFHMWAGVIATILVIIILTSSFWRKKLHIDYDRWRFWHAVLAVAVLVFSIFHIGGVGYYTHAPWKTQLWIVILASWITVLLYMRLVKPAFILRHPFKVAEVIQERGSTWTLVLNPDGHTGIRFAPGQFAWISIWHSPFALKEHPFSISSSAEQQDRLTFTIKELGDFTRRIGRVTPGEKVFVDGPYGSFSIDRQVAPGYVFIAGGVGIAPIMGMLRTLADRDDKRPLLLVYAYNTWERLTFREELDRIKKKLNLRMVVVLNDPPEGWSGEKGMVTQELLSRYLPEDRASREYFICGPVPMLNCTERALRNLHVPMNRINSELFDLV